jgi:adenosylcobinamide-phosphate synthase
VASDLSILIGAIGFDLLIGEPPARIHPVVWIGKLQDALRRSAPKGPAAELAWGTMMAIIGPAIFGGGAWLLLRSTHGLVRWGLAAYLLKSAFAWRELAAAGLRVHRPLARGDLAAAKAALSRIVSRDTSPLTPPLVAAAAIESVAENCSDSIVAPLLFFAIAGVPGALAYRAINTLDAMIGYRGDLEWLGKAAARLDDLANLVPARLTALLLAAAASLGRGSPARAVAIWWRDGSLTESPNAGHPMAAMAGALGLELEKPGVYRLGAGLGTPGSGDIIRGVWIMCGAASIALLLMLLVKAHGA